MAKLQGRSTMEAVAFAEMVRLAATGRPMQLGVAVEAVQRARVDVGLQPYKGGSASDLVQRFTAGYKLHGEESRPPLFRKDGRLLVPVARDWHPDWRLLFTPRHGAVRALARDGLLLDPAAAVAAKRSCPGHGRFLPPDAVLPEVDVVAGPGAEIREHLLKHHAARQSDSRFVQGVPGIYFLSRGEGLYVGETGEVLTRHRQHSRKTKAPITWMAFVSRCADEGPLTSDALGAAEALLISFWSQVATLDNASGGRDTAPADLRTLREATAFATVAAAALVRLHRQGTGGIVVPFAAPLAEVYAGAGASALPVDDVDRLTPSSMPSSPSAAGELPITVRPAPGAKPARLLIHNQAWEVATWGELLLVALGHLHAARPDRYDATFTAPEFEGRKMRSFQRTPEGLRSPREIPGGFAEVNRSAESINGLVAALVTFFGIQSSSVRYSIREG
jgi:hypothetical protein